MQRFQRFLQKSGGHTGGWGEVEHAAFIKSWLKYSNAKSDSSRTPHILRLVEAMQKLLPGSNFIINNCLTADCQKVKLVIIGAYRTLFYTCDSFAPFFYPIFYFHRYIKGRGHSSLQLGIRIQTFERHAE